ncbi:MAG: NHL repeat-containing protein [Candidatus Latescibacterota bacterium]
MKSWRICLAVTLFCLILSSAATAQQWVNPNFDNQRIDCRDLGYPGQTLIPADNSCITSLLAHSNGLIYGATSGRTQSSLFLYYKYNNKVRPLGTIAKETGVHHGLVEGRDGEIYIGTGLNMFAPVKLTRDFPVALHAIEEQLWKDICTPYANYEGGHIYRYIPKTGDVVRRLAEDPCPVEDLGIPVPKNTVYAMTMNPDKTKIYGVSYPDAHFFIFDIATKKTRDLGEFLGEKVYNGPERHWRSVPRALWCDPKTGYVYTSGDNGFIIRLDPKTSKFEKTGIRLPGEYWERLKSEDYPVVECFDTDSRGNLYAATNDGYLIRIDLEAGDRVVLGKPRIMRRCRAMKVGMDDKIYMITGELDRICKLHTYDLSGKEGFSELGVLAVDRSPYYQHHGFSFDCMAIGADGTVFCGENDRRGKLFLYIPGPGAFKGDYNPTNPVLKRMDYDTPALIPENL